MTVKSIFSATAASCFIGTALVAGSLDDAPQTPTIPAAQPTSVVDWSGHYGGAFLGYGDGDYQQGVSALNQIGPDVGVDGTIGGLRYGMNWQNANRVYGFDVSLSSGIDGIVAQGTSSAPDWNCVTGDCNVSINAMLTVRGRYGATLNDGQTMWYGAAGLAAAKVEGGIYNSGQQGIENTAVGFTAGIGIEHMLNDRFSAYGELNYIDLGNLEFGTGAGETYDGVGSFSTLAIGVNYHF